MSKKISELSTTSQANNEDILILNQNDETKQISKEDLFADTEQRIEDSSTALTNLIGVDEYSEEGVYSVGDYCLHENNLYLCIVAITTPEVWDSAKWQQTDITEGTVRTLAGTVISGGMAIKLGNVMIQTGQITNVTVPATGYTGYPVTFPKEFAYNPNVFITPTGNYNIIGQATSITTTGFTINVRSVDGNTRTGRVYHYMAIGNIE